MQHAHLLTSRAIGRAAVWLRRCFIFLTCLLAAGYAGAQQAQESAADRVVWRMGSDFQKQLASATSVEWREAKLRQRLEHLAATHRVAIFLDRRVDPDREIDFSLTGVSLEELLQQLAQQVGAQTTRLGSLIYFGPPRACGQVSAVAPLRRKEVDRHPTLARARPQPWFWDELAEPRQLLLDLAKKYQLSVENPEAVPHDLWPAGDLPPLDLADQLTLLLAGFDQTFEVSADGRRLRLVPMPADAPYEQTYTLAGDAVQAVAALRRDFPNATVRREGNRVIVRGSSADHEKIAERLDGASVRPRGSAKSTTNYTMTVMNQSAGAVVNTVARRLGKKLTFAPALQEKLSQTVNFTVKEVSLDELMAKTLHPLGLTYRMTEEAIEVVEKKNK